ncbi:MAG: PAS domain S-box protein [Cyanobacteria bacterium HKST-UBA01]|nr:PAS domain S-box protein [Cyanobacteria bacterium HKST-UBA01]
MSEHQQSEALLKLIEQQKDVIRNLEKSLAESESTVRTIVSRLPHGFIVLSEDSRMVAVNNRVVEIFEYSTEELSGAAIDLLFPGVQAVTELPPNIELKARTKSGERRFVMVAVTGVRIQGRSQFFVHINDTTEQHKLEQLKRDFVNMLSHDLRSPLTSLQILLTMLEQGEFGKLESDGPKRVTNAKVSADRLIKMISELLDLEKMEEGLFKLHRIETSVSSIIDGAIDDVFDLCDARDIMINSQLGEYYATIDPDQIRRVAVNLLTNAIKVSPAFGSISVKIEQQGEALHISFRDQGPGIALDAQETIFDRFRQLDENRQLESGEKKMETGSGLGLAICKAIVEAHGGKIGVVSESEDNTEDGKGSEFWFTVPLL